MTSPKQRRFLIGLAIGCLVLWVITSFGPMAFWYFSNQMSPPTPEQMSPSLCLHYWQCWKDSAFTDAPTFGAGYFILAMVIFGFLAKKKSNDKNDA